MAPSASPVAVRDGGRYPELDGHRGIAVVAVVVFHVYQFCNVDHFLYGGTPGYILLNSLDAMVPWFFVIAAFLLFEPLARSAIEGRPPISVRGFLTRRLIRIVPVYYVAVIVVWFIRQQGLPGDWRDLVEHLTFTQVFDEKRIFYTIGPAWSLSVTVHFYLLLVLLAVVLPRICRRLPDRRQRIGVLAGSTAAVGVVSLAWKTWAFSDGRRPSTGFFTTWFGPLANFDAFAVGMALAVVAASLGPARPLGSGSRLALRLTALAVLTLAFATRDADAGSGVYFSVTCSVGFGCLVAAAVLGPRTSRWGRVLSGRPLRWLGDISYSLYLWHEPVLLALLALGLIRPLPGDFGPNVLVVVAVSVVVGWLSYTFIERPTGQLGQMFGPDGRFVRPGEPARPVVAHLSR